MLNGPFISLATGGGADLGFGDGLLPFGLTVLAIVGLLAATDWLLRRRSKSAHHTQFVRHLTMLGLTLVALVIVVLALPVSNEIRGQVLTLLGIGLTAVVGLASTTIIANAMSGLLLRTSRNITPGDFIRVGDHFGRVTERGLFHTELQTEFSDLTTLPNFFLLSQPVTVVRSSGTVVHAELSLGYDVPEGEVRRALIAAAESVGLREPFVHVLDLGDFSIRYRVAGLLDDVKTLVSRRSELRRAALHALHDADIEIVSPTFMVQRPQRSGERAMPTTGGATTAPDAPSLGSPDAPERLIFDKAERAEVLASLATDRDRTADEIKRLKQERSSAASDNERNEIDERIKRSERRRDMLVRMLDRAAARADEE